MFEINKKDLAFKELAEYANSINEPLKDVLLSDEHLDIVSKIFYKHMPKMIKWSMKEMKFKEFYKNHRTALVSQIIV